jgi:cytochrome c biogenesis protein CcmG/thiol:disulfide interchange protein DsbE
VTTRAAFSIWLIVIAVLIGAYWLLSHNVRARVDVGSLAPDFAAVNVATGKRVTLHDGYRGAVTLVNIWGTWCGPCRLEMPAMDSLYRSLAARGFRIAAVSIDEKSVDDVRKFVADHNLAFDVLNDSTGRIKEIYQTTGAPESFLVDRTGHIVRIAQLAAPWNSPENHRIVEQLLAAPAS